MKIKIFMVVLILIQLTFSQDTESVETEKVGNSWLIAGIGAGSDDHLSFTAAYTFSGNTLYKLSIDGNSTFNIFGSELEESISAINFSVGEKIEYEYLLLAGYLGASYLNWEYHNKSGKGFGSKIGMQLVFLPVYELGIGIDFFQNFNTYKNFNGLRFVLFLRSSR